MLVSYITLVVLNVTATDMITVMTLRQTSVGCVCRQKKMTLFHPTLWPHRTLLYHYMLVHLLLHGILLHFNNNSGITRMTISTY